MTSRRVTFPRVLHSEWVKLVSLRSTYWTIGATLVVMVLIALLLGTASRVESTTGAPGPDGAMAIGMGYSFAQVVVAVLGTLMITGEYATGMIRSTLVAVPLRLPALAGKALLIAAVGFVVGVAGVALSYAVSYPLLGAAAAADLGDPEVQRIFWGSGLYLAGVGLLGLGVGALLRHTAGAITVTLGVLLMLGTVMQLLMLTSTIFRDIYPFLPTTAGERIVTPVVAAAAPDAPRMLGPWQGYAVFMTYVAATLSLAAALLRRRDA